jgi:hypothetical protein
VPFLPSPPLVDRPRAAPLSPRRPSSRAPFAARGTIQGRIVGFDEYMNLVLDDAEEIDVKSKARKSIGRILLKGDTITLMSEAPK